MIEKREFRGKGLARLDMPCSRGSYEVKVKRIA